jgi:hypothetical protein
MKARRRSGDSYTFSLTSELDGVGGQPHAPAVLPLGKRHGAYCAGGWVGPRDGLGWCEKSRRTRIFDPRIVHPVANRYTDYAVPANGNCASRRPVFIGKNNSGLVKTERILRLGYLLTHGKNLARELKAKGSICGKDFNFYCSYSDNFVPCSNCWRNLYLMWAG